jgi:uncharacterized protein (DUF1501 family)
VIAARGAGTKRQVFVSLGGFDTHDFTAAWPVMGRSAALGADGAMVQLGVADRVTFTASDFDVR